MKKLLLNISLFIFIILTVFNSIFLTETIRNQDLSKFYFKGEELPIIYSEIEKIHMQEVKHLVNMSIGANLILLAAVIILSRNSKLRLREVGISLLIFSLTMIILSLSFIELFTEFHLLFFNSDNWLLPENSILIQTYPLDYFAKIFVLIITIIACIGIILARGNFKTKEQHPKKDEVRKKNLLE